jgi:copper chaperone CopZ
MTTRVFTVEGMTCSHCAGSISTEVAKVPGVTDVQVDVGAKNVQVSGETLEDSAIRAAIEEAGYTVAG